MKRFSNILLVVGADTEQTVALQRAIAVVKNNQATLTICTVVDDVPASMQMAIVAITPAEIREYTVKEQCARLNVLSETAVRQGVPAESTVLVGKPFIEVIRRVVESEHDLVIKTAEGATGLNDMFFGSTDMHLMRKCPCPVWMIKSDEHEQYRRILVAVDQDHEDEVESDLNQQLLELSSSLALAEFGELHIVHAWALPSEGFLRSRRSGMSDAEVDEMVTKEAVERKNWLDKLAHTFGNQSDKESVNYLHPKIHVVKGKAKYVIPATARDLGIDLVVMGTVARTGIPGFFMGNTAESILNQIDCSVLTIKPSGFNCPIGVNNE